ncbi:Hypothetical protein CINCED_3A001134 [Cinara cedri]|uniref:Uncharacterized protein n=1 Tax=Cinara cedri TaxID=506608 RepID=A0A5E4N029_9HEMI|nr:Hypothetical protein CINCED_3A001134 [Cinara cedri]
MGCSRAIHLSPATVIVLLDAYRKTPDCLRYGLIICFVGGWVSRYVQLLTFMKSSPGGLRNPGVDLFSALKGDPVGRGFVPWSVTCLSYR